MGDPCHSVGKTPKAVRGDRSQTRLYYTHYECNILNRAVFSGLSGDVVAAGRRLGVPVYNVGGGNRCVCSLS